MFCNRVVLVIFKIDLIIFELQLFWSFSSVNLKFKTGLPHTTAKKKIDTINYLSELAFRG